MGSTLSGSPSCLSICLLMPLEQAFKNLVVHKVGHGHLELRTNVHSTFDGEHGTLVTGPAATADTIVYVPMQHHA